MRLLLAIIVAVAGCAAQQHPIQLVNRTERTIDEVYVYRSGSPDHGKSRASLAPNASAVVNFEQGNVDVYAVSAKVQLDEHTRDRPSASSSVELKGPVQVIFYDLGHKPAEVDRPGVIGVAFTRIKSNAPPSTPEPAPEP